MPSNASGCTAPCTKQGGPSLHRLGGREPKRVDVRIIAATHQDLAAKVRAGYFREDLYHRLNVIRLLLPPLRERREDIPLLANHFLTRAAHQLGVEPKRLTPEALAALTASPFPGNVRELENLCHWLTVMAPAAAITVTDLPPEYQPPLGNRDQPPAVVATPPAAFASSFTHPNQPAAPDHAPAPLATATPLDSALPDWQTPLAAAVRQLLAAHPVAHGPTTLYEQLREAFDQCLLNAALLYTHGHRRRAAALLGVSRNAFRRKRIPSSSSQEFE